MLALSFLLMLPHVSMSQCRTEILHHSQQSNPEVYRDGDLVIGGFFPLLSVEVTNFTGAEHPHKTYSPFKWMHKNYQQVLALEFAVEEINRNPNLIPNVTLGYHLYNTHHSEARSLESSLRWLSGRNEVIPNYNCESRQKSVAVIGGATSAMAVQMRMLLELYKFPQTNEIPGFRTFLRTIKPATYPEDIFLKSFWNSAFECPDEIAKLETEECLPNASLEMLPAQYFDTATSGPSFTIYNAIYAVAWALHEMLLRRSEMGSVRGLKWQNVLPWQIHSFLNNVQFNNGAGDQVVVDEERNPVAKYDIMNYVVFLNVSDSITKVGQFIPEAPLGQDLIIYKTTIVWNWIGSEYHPRNINLYKITEYFPDHFPIPTALIHPADMHLSIKELIDSNNRNEKE